MQRNTTTQSQNDRQLTKPSRFAQATANKKRFAIAAIVALTASQTAFADYSFFASQNPLRKTSPTPAANTLRDAGTSTTQTALSQSDQASQTIQADNWKPRQKKAISSAPSAVAAVLSKQASSVPATRFITSATVTLFTKQSTVPHQVDLSKPNRMLNVQLLDADPSGSAPSRTEHDSPVTATFQKPRANDNNPLSGNIRPDVSAPLATSVLIDRLVDASGVSTGRVTITPTVGHFTQLDSTWVFVPSQGIARVISAPKDVQPPSPANGFREAAAVNDLRTSTQNFVELFPANPFRCPPSQRAAASRGNNDSFFVASVAPQPLTQTDELSLMHAAVNDDLMLQRVLQTIRKEELMQGVFSGQSSIWPTKSNTRADAPATTTPRWEVSGELSRTDGRVELSLHSAKLIRI